MAQTMAAGEMGMPTRKRRMFFRQYFKDSVAPTDKRLERAWEDTVVGPFDPLRESDIKAPLQTYDHFALTVPMGLSAK